MRALLPYMKLVCGASLEAGNMVVGLCEDCPSDSAPELKRARMMHLLWVCARVNGGRKRKGGEWLPIGEGTEMLKSPDGVKVKSATVIENSDSVAEYLG